MLQCNFWMIHSVGEHPSWSQVDSLLPATALRGCSWTGIHRSVLFIFGSESSSPRRFLGITHSFRVTRKRLKCLENAFPAINFSKFSRRRPRGLRAFGARGWPTPPAAPPRTSTQFYRESMPVSPPNRIHHVRLCLRSQCLRCFVQTSGRRQPFFMSERLAFCSGLSFVVHAEER